MWRACAVITVGCLSFDLSDPRGRPRGYISRPFLPVTPQSEPIALYLHAGLVAGLLARRSSPIFNGQATLFFARTMATGAKIQGQCS